MKILIVGHAYLSLINREKWTAYSKAFPHDVVTVVTPTVWKDALFTVEKTVARGEGACRYIHLPVQRSGNEVLHRYAWGDVWRTLNDVAPDVLLVEQGDNAFAYFQWILVSLLQLRQIPRVFFTWVNWKHPWGWRYRLLWRPIEFFNSFFSTAAIVGNPEAEKLLREKKFMGAVLISPQLGITLEERVTAPNVAHEKRKAIGFVGRLMQEKGVHILVRAFAALVRDYPEWDVYIVGSGSDQVSLMQLASDLGIQNRVIFTGAVDHYRALQFVNAFDVLVLPSLDTAVWREQFGHVIIEAMAAGVPVIGSDAGAIAWVIGDAGLVVPQNDVNALCEALKKYMSDDGVRASYGARGRERAKTLYSHDVIAQRVGNFLHTLAR